MSTSKSPNQKQNVIKNDIVKWLKQHTYKNKNLCESLYEVIKELINIREGDNERVIVPASLADFWKRSGDIEKQDFIRRELGSIQFK